MASSYSGYNDIYSHGSVYSLFFVLLINMILPDIHPQVLLRMDRKPYIRRLYAWNIVAAGLFAIMFFGIAVANTTIVIGASKLWAWGYYKAAMLSLILTFLYYVLTGTVFLFLYILTGTKTKALFVTYFISVVLVGLPFFIRLHWTPVTSLAVMDAMLENRFRYSSVILDMAKLTGLSAFLYLFTIYIFKGKGYTGEKWIRRNWRKNWFLPQ